MTATKGAGNASVTYNSNALTGYINTQQLNNTVAELEATVMNSTGEESDPGLTNSTLDIGGDWNATLDGYLAPDSLAGTKRTAVITYTAGGSTITWTWTSKAFITNYQVQSEAKGKITWTAKLRLSGLGVRS